MRVSSNELFSTSPIHLQSTHAYCYDSGRNHGHERSDAARRRQPTRAQKRNWTEASTILEADPPQPLQMSRRSLLSAH